MGSAVNPILAGMDPAVRASIVAAMRGGAGGAAPIPSPGAGGPSIASAGAPVANPKPLATPQAPSPSLSMTVHHTLEPEPSQPISMPQPGIPEIAGAPQPRVIAPRGTLQGDQDYRGHVLQSGSGISQIAHKIEGSDFGQAHPTLAKVLGYGAQGAATLGDIGLSLTGPGRIAEGMIPGTAGYHAATLAHANSAVNQDEASAGKEATTADVRSQIPLREAQTENLRNPPDKFSPLPTENGIQAFNPKEGTATPLTDASGKPLQPFQPNKVQNIDEQAYASLTGQGKSPIEALNTIYGSKNTKIEDLPHLYLDALQAGDQQKAALIKKAHEDTQVKPTQPPGVTMIVPNADGSGTVQRLKAGDTVAPGAQTAAGVNSMNTPTTIQRTAAGRAATVVAMAPEVLKEIDDLAPKLGPVMGNWNAFYQGRVGMDDPDFAGLRTDLVMLSSAVALAHAQGRLPENLRQEFDSMINAPKQTPENLKSVINHVLPWLQKMQEQGQRPGGGAPRGGGANDPLGIR